MLWIVRALLCAILIATAQAAQPVKVYAPNNASFARSLILEMPGHDMPPTGAFTMHLRLAPGRGENRCRPSALFDCAPPAFCATASVVT